MELPLQDIRKNIPSIISKVLPSYTKACVWYNLALQKLDLHFTAPDNATLPAFTIGSGKGRPAYQHQMRAHILPCVCVCVCVKSRAVSALGTCLLLASPMSAQSHHLCSPSCSRWAEYLRPSSILTRVGTPNLVSPVPAAVVKEGVSWVYSWQRSKQQTALCATGPRSPSRHTA